MGVGGTPSGAAPDTAAVNGQAHVFVAHEDGAAESCGALRMSLDALAEHSESFPCLTCMLLWLPVLVSTPVGLCVWDGMEYGCNPVGTFLLRSEIRC